jgi:hypothetical protein
LNEKSKKMGPRGVLTKEEDVAMITWILTMEDCGLSITLQQLKMKVHSNINKGYTILKWNTK